MTRTLYGVPGRGRLSGGPVGSLEVDEEARIFVGVSDEKSVRWSGLLVVT